MAAKVEPLAWAALFIGIVVVIFLWVTMDSRRAKYHHHGDSAAAKMRKWMYEGTATPHPFANY